MAAVSPRIGFLNRWLLAFSSLSPVLMILAVRGTTSPDIDAAWFSLWLSEFALLGLLLAPAVVGRAARTSYNYTADTTLCSEVKDHTVVYALAVTLALSAMGLDSLQNVAATALTFTFVLWLFAASQLHYANPVLMLMGWHLYKLAEPISSGKSGVAYMVLSKHRKSELPDTLHTKIIDDYLLVDPG